MKKHKLFYQCLLISATLHLTAVWIFYTQPVFLQPILSSIFGKNAATVVVPLADEDINLSEKNIALEEVFNQIIVLSPSMQKPYDYERAILSDLAVKPKTEAPSQKAVVDLVSNLPPSSGIQEAAKSQTPALAFPSDLLNATLDLECRVSPIPRPYCCDKAPSREFVRDLQKNLPMPVDKAPFPDQLANLSIHYTPVNDTCCVKTGAQSSPSNVSALVMPPSELIALVSPDELFSEAPIFDAEPVLSYFLAEAGEAPKRNLEAHSTSLPALASYALPLGSGDLEWSEDFMVEVKTMEQEEGGFLFSVTFLPKYDMSQKKMKQNYTFLIDRTNSIEKYKYQTFKRGVSKALLSLREGDNFNIVLFDKKITRLSNKPLAFNKKALQLAQDFLEKQSPGNFSAASDIYRHLADVIPTNIPDDEENSVILISDGDSTLNPDRQAKLVQSFFEKTSKKFTLYTAAAGQGNNLTMLDLLSSFCRGSLLFSDTHAAFPRKLAKLVINLRYPVAKELMLTVMKADPKSRIQVFPAPGHIPTLFSDRPLTIFGKAEKLSDFVVMLQGRSGNQLLTVQKTVSFESAKKNVRSLERDWAKYQTHLYYDQYLQNGNVSFLEKAKPLLPYDGKTPRNRR